MQANLIFRDRSALELDVHELDVHGLLSLSPVRYWCMEYLMLLCMAVSSYVRKGVSAAAAVRLILYFDIDWEDRPSLAFYGNDLRPRGCKSIHQTRDSLVFSRFLDGFRQCPLPIGFD